MALEQVTGNHPSLGQHGQGVSGGEPASQGEQAGTSFFSAHGLVALGHLGPRPRGEETRRTHENEGHRPRTSQGDSPTGEDSYGPGDTHEFVLDQLAHRVSAEGLFQRLRVVLAQPPECGDGAVL